MRVKASVMILGILLLAICLVLEPVGAAGGLSLNPAKGEVGSQVAIPNSCSYGEGNNYYIYWDEANQLIDQGVIPTTGCPSLFFTIPEASRGSHKVTLRSGGDYYDRDFIIVPTISLSSEEGTAGTSLTVVGHGFNSNEIGIKLIYDGNTLESGITANSKGSWQRTFAVPPSSGGDHVIDAGGTTPETEVDDQIFTVVPQISVSPSSGWVGTVVSIAGTGFGRSETNITVTYDNLAAKTGITANDAGSWQSTFSVPTSAKGDHKIDAYGGATDVNTVTDVDFTVSPGVRLEVTSGRLGDAVHVGDNLWVSGFGFEENESGIKVTFDGTQVASGVVADAKGSWATLVEVPLGTKGEHAIDALGETTQASDVNGAQILISPQIEVSPTAVNVGDDIVVSGTGFSGTQPITLSYGGNQVATGLATDAKGVFTTSFKLTKGQPGTHAITATDATAAVASASITLESTPPATPKPVSPEAGSEVGFIGETIVTFDWSPVEDPSGVFYVLEISSNPDFSGAMLRKEGLTQPKYTLTDHEALEKGDYYWRVRAIDGAGNEGDWTNGQLLRVGVISLWMLVLIGVIGIGIIAVIIWRVISVIKRSS